MNWFASAALFVRVSSCASAIAAPQITWWW
jgi:hypothetical protein